MKNKTKSILLGVLCAVCLQVPLNVCAVDLPASENTDSEKSALLVLSPDDESTAEISESSYDSSLSGEKDSSDTQITANTNSKDITEASKALL